MLCKIDRYIDYIYIYIYCMCHRYFELYIICPKETIDDFEWIIFRINIISSYYFLYTQDFFFENVLTLNL